MPHSEPRAARPGKYLTFVLDGRTFAVAVETVREITQLGDVTPVPQMPAFLAGVTNLRGKIIPVMSLRLKFGLSEAPPTRSTCIVVIEAEQGLVGAIVDSVADVIDLSAAAIETLPLSPEPSDGCLVGLGKENDRVIVLLDATVLASRTSLSTDVTVKLAV